MRLFHFVALLVVLAIACGQPVTLPTEQSTAPAALSARVNSGAMAETMPRMTTERPQTNAITKGLVYVRSCASTACKPLGSIEAGKSVLTVGGVIVTTHPDCQHWQPVKFEGNRGYVCADFLEVK